MVVIVIILGKEQIVKLVTRLLQFPAPDVDTSSITVPMIHAPNVLVTNIGKERNVRTANSLAKTKESLKMIAYAQVVIVLPLGMEQIAQIVMTMSYVTIMEQILQIVATHVTVLTIGIQQHYVKIAF